MYEKKNALNICHLAMYICVCVCTIAIEFHICGAKTCVAIFIRNNKLKFKNMCEHFDSAEKIFYVNI